MKRIIDGREVDEEDICDLDPNKICDNCCKCIENDETDYRGVLADIALPEDALIVEEDIENELSDPIEYEQIDPTLMKEWEAKLKEYESTLAEDEKVSSSTQVKTPSNGTKGIKKKKL